MSAALQEKNDILVSMTRKPLRPSPPPARRRARKSRPGIWALQDAKARFSELVRLVRSEGPQRVTVHGRDEVVVLSAEEFRRLQGEPTGAALIAAMRAIPTGDLKIERVRERSPVRDVELP
jgi:prevent-host-death family protein